MKLASHEFNIVLFMFTPFPSLPPSLYHLHFLMCSCPLSSQTVQENHNIIVRFPVYLAMISVSVYKFVHIIIPAIVNNTHFIIGSSQLSSTLLQKQANIDGFARSSCVL